MNNGSKQGEVVDFSVFDHPQHMSVLTWLGKREWTVYQDYPEKRAVAMKPRPFVFAPTPNQEIPENALIVSRTELQKYPNEHWDILKQLINVLDYDVIGTFWYNTLAKSLAGGPKLFRPTPEQCIALENTEATFPFDMYRQPYPVVIIEIPDGYRTHLKNKYGVADTPSHVLVNHDDKDHYIAVSAFVSNNNIITHLTPKREEYATIEDSIVKNRDRRKDHILASNRGRVIVDPDNTADFDAAENVQRLAMNFAMMMTLLGVKNTGHINPEDYKRWKKESLAKRRGGIATHRAIEAQQKLAGAMYLIEFEQKIDFYDEIEENVEVSDVVELERLHKSPKTHWRRGHWTQQPYGPNRSLRKPVFRKPLLVRAKYFLGDTKNTTVTYTAHPKKEG